MAEHPGPRDTAQRGPSHGQGDGGVTSGAPHQLHVQTSSARRHIYGLAAKFSSLDNSAGVIKTPK